MGNFGRDSRPSGGGRSYSRPSFGGRGGSDRPEMHKAICSECGKECMVPFRPTGSKPVFCSNCFEKQRGSEPREFGNRDSRPPFRNPRFENKPRFDSDDRRPQPSAPAPQYDRQFEALNAKLDKLITLLTPVTSAKVAEAPKAEEPVVVVEKKKKSSKKVVIASEE